MVVREIYARLGIKVDKKGHQEAGLMFTELHSKLELLKEAFEVGKEFVQELVGETVNYAKEINKTARMTGLTTDSLQELSFVAHENGLEFGTLQRALFMLQRKGFGAADEKLASLVETFESVKDPAVRAQMASKLLGRGYREMMPILTMGKAKFQEMREEAHELGLVMSKDDLQAADKLNKGMKKWHATVEGIKRTIAGPFVRILGDVVASVNEWTKANREWIAEAVTDALKDLVWVLRAVFNIGRSFYNVIKDLSEMFGGWTVGILGAVIAMKLWGDSTTLVTLKWLAFAAVVALVIEDFLFFLKGQPSLINDITKALDAFWNDWSPAAAKKKLKDLEDHPILNFLRIVLYTVTHIAETWDNWVDALTTNPLAKKLFGGAELGAKAKTQVQSGVNAKIAANPEQFVAQAWGSPYYQPADIKQALIQAGIPGAKVEELMKLRPNAAKMGGGATPSASAAIARGTDASPVTPLTYAPHTEVHVHAKTGADAADIAGAVRQTVDDAHETHVRVARDALIPVPAE